MRKLSIILLLTIMVFPALAVNDLDPKGARSCAMGGASLTLKDFWSIGNNQAGLAYYDKIGAGFFYENRFMLKELGQQSGAVVVPAKFGVLGLSFGNFGYSLYNEQKLGLAYARKFGEKFSVGVQLDYFRLNLAEEYGSKGLVTFEAGIRSQLTKEIALAAHIFNPVRVSIADYNDERMPTVLSLGMSYSFSDKAIVAIEAEKDLDLDPLVKAGIEYHLIEAVYLRAGIASKPVYSTFGFGLKFGEFRFDFSSSIHQTLGYSPQVSLVYAFK